MKVIHSAITDGLSGTTGNSVLMRSRSPKFSYLRTWAQPARTIQNDDIGKAAKNIGSQIIEMNQLAIKDLKDYAKKYKDIPYFGDKYKERAGNWFAVWTKIIYHAAYLDEEQDEMKNGSIKQLLGGKGIEDVATCCEMGILPKVPGYEEMTNLFFTT